MLVQYSPVHVSGKLIVIAQHAAASYGTLTIPWKAAHSLHE